MLRSFLHSVSARLATSALAVLAPVFEPATEAPPGAGADDFLAYVNIDDEEMDEQLMDLVASEEEQREEPF